MLSLQHPLCEWVETEIFYYLQIIPVAYLLHNKYFLLRSFGKKRESKVHLKMQITSFLIMLLMENMVQQLITALNATEEEEKRIQINK